MLLKHRPPGIQSLPVQPRNGLEHLDRNWLAVLSWLKANKVDFVVVGAAARGIRGEVDATGPVAVVPAPYGRNYERLSRALVYAHARLRVGTGSRVSGEPDTAPVKLTAEKLARGTRWMLRCAVYDLDIEGGAARRAGRPEGAPDYQELLYEAGRFELAAGVSVEVASPEDLEHYDHLRRTGTAPEIRISRTPKGEGKSATPIL
jgi:hypothetical protein